MAIGKLITLRKCKFFVCNEILIFLVCKFLIFFKRLGGLREDTNKKSFLMVGPPSKKFGKTKKKIVKIRFRQL